MGFKPEEKIMNAEDAEMNERRFIKAFLAGPTGTGKTMGATTLPLINGKPLLLIDLDGRWETVAGMPNLKILQLYDESPESAKAWNEVEDTRKWLWSLARKAGKGEEEFPYSGIIEDGLSMLTQLAMNSALLLDNKRGLGGAPAQQHWLPQIHYIRKHINAMRNLPCHYVLTGHLELINDEDTGGIKILPKVTRSLRTELPSWFNEVYLCHREKVKENIVYYWTTGGTGKYEFFKSALNKLGKFWKDPIEVNFDKPPVGFQHLLKLREKGGQKDG